MEQAKSICITFGSGALVNEVFKRMKEQGETNPRVFLTKYLKKIWKIKDLAGLKKITCEKCNKTFLALAGKFCYGCTQEILRENKLKLKQNK